MKNNKGFSLVELIVVIAIMAILAAVAVIGVSVYIPRAQEANDNELLNIMSDALTSACLSEGIDQREVVASVTVNADGTFDRDAVSGLIKLGFSGNNLSDAQKAKIAETFNNVLADKNAKFNLITEVTTIVFKNGKFDLNNTLSAYDKLTFSQADIDALKGSTFGEMGMKPLLEQLDNITEIASGLTSHSAFQNVLGSDGFKLSAAATYGIDTSKPGWEQDLLKKQNELVDKLMENNPELTRAEAESQILANATVMYTAQQTAQLSDQEIADLLENPNRQTIIDNMSGANSSSGLVQAALMCGMYTSYVNSSAYPEGADKTVNTSTVLEALEDEGFLNYLNSDQGKADLAGYRGSLNMINSSVDNEDAMSDLMINGFADPDLIDSLNQSIGKN